MTWEEFCTWCAENDFNRPTIIKRTASCDKYPYYVRITWGSGRNQGSKGYGIADQTPTPAELQEIVNNPSLP